MLDKIKKMLMKKDDLSKPTMDLSKLAVDPEEAAMVEALENDPSMQNLQELSDQMANEELDQEEMIKRNEEMLATPEEQPIADVAVVDGATELQPTEEELEELKNPADFDDEYLEYSAEAVGFENREQQWDTYRTVSAFFDPEDSVLDFGCARGDFERFFETEYGTDLDYKGVDFNKQLIDAGNKAYNEEVELIHSDWFKLSNDVNADICININSSNLRYDADTTKTDEQYLHATIEAMVKHCKKASILLLASDASNSDDGLINWNAGSVLNWAINKFGSAAVDHSFSDDIFTLIIYKN